MDEFNKEPTEHFQFPITPFLQRKLNALSKQANSEGEKTVRWTDLILAGLNKLEPQDLVRLQRERKNFLNKYLQMEDRDAKTL